MNGGQKLFENLFGHICLNEDKRDRKPTVTKAHIGDIQCKEQEHRH